MLRMTKVAGLIAAALGGSVFGCGCSPCGWKLPNLSPCGWNLGGFCKGLFARGFTDCWAIDAVTDWLREDLFS